MVKHGKMLNKISMVKHGLGSWILQMSHGTSTVCRGRFWSTAVHGQSFNMVINMDIVRSLKMSQAFDHGCFMMFYGKHFWVDQR